MSELARDDDSIEADGGASSRRRFMRRGAAAAAAAAAAGIAVSSPASAANGDNLRIGLANAGTATTQLSGSRLFVTNGNGGISLFGSHTASEGVGVYGAGGSSSAAGVGVRGYSELGTGVEGRANTGVGVHGEGGSSTLRGVGLRGTSQLGAQLLLDANTISVPPSGSWARGSVIANTQGLWYATQTGTGAAANWVRLSSVLQPLPTPIRAYDSRPGQTPATGPKTPITAGTQRNIDLTGTSLLPTTARAAFVNVTVTNTSSGGGFLKVFPAGAAIPVASNINWSGSGQTIANATFVGLDAGGSITVRAGGTGASTDFIIDVLAFTF